MPANDFRIGHRALRRCRLAGLLRSIVAITVPSLASSASADELGSFIWLYQCPIVERLEIIARTSEPDEYDRFIVVALEGWPQRYVQCMFTDQKISFLCEASSGYYGPAKGEPGHLELPKYARAELADLGFETEATEGNYQLETELSVAGRFEEIASLMLAALYHGYGAWPGAALMIYAPLAPELPPGSSQCVPVG